MYLFFDTETTGLPKNWKAPVTDVANWPRMVQIAWICYNNKGKLLSNCEYIIKPDGYTIPDEVTKIHGITTQKAQTEGQEIIPVLDELSALIDEASYLVAHNYSFDEKIIGAEFIRYNIPNKLFDSKKKKICTMLKSAEFVGIPGNYGYKWPKLSELYHKLFGTYFDEAHHAGVDIEATARCFWEMKRRKII